MALERLLPLVRIPVRRMMYPLSGSSWDAYSNTFTQIDSQMKNMYRDMNRMLQDFEDLTPPMTCQEHRHSENFRVENPIVTDKDGSKKMHLAFDVRHFKPEEIKIKTKDNKYLEIEARHEDKSDSGHSVREYKRVFSIPDIVDAQTMQSVLTSDGVLTVEARIKEAIEEVTKEEPCTEPININITHES